MIKLERKLTRMASANGYSVSDTELYSASGHLVRFLRAVTELKKEHDDKMRDFGSDQFRKTRQRILSAGAGISPVRLCDTPANDRIA
ncbi:MAG: hypothetical protein IJU89_00365 [Alphaproteobacteria bacterium]|nr:hypothetical protein [Alphaproteobacteria bacterium]